MRCIKPLILGTADERAKTVPCGRCNFCLMSNRMDWTIRLLQEAKICHAQHFLTLTYDDDYLSYSPSGEPTLEKKDLQLFFKRLRKENAKHTNYSIRYFAVGEYGETTQRPHYHAILFNVHPNTINKLDTIWGCGIHKLGTVTVSSIHYVTGYLIGRYDDHGDKNSPFALQSRRPGLGQNYIKTHAKWNRPDDNPDHWRNYTKINGYTNRLPRYYRDRIFSKEELQLLNQKAAQLFDETYLKELDRLSKLYPRAETYQDLVMVYNERVQTKHDKIKVKKNKNL